MTVEILEQANEGLILGFLAESGAEFTSGEALSDKLGLSRTAVWKHVNALRLKGYRIDAIPARGYRLVEVPDRLTALELAPLLNTHDVGAGIHAFETLPSTNVTAFELAREGAAHGEIVIAEEQTQGKGRRGRAWVSPKGQNLYFSVILRPDLPPHVAPELTLVAAVALAETIEDSGLKATIKWPNDVQVGGKKVGGILTELSAEVDVIHFVILGMGVNLNIAAADFPPELKDIATSLSEAKGARVSRSLFAAALFTRLEEWLDLHQEQGFAPVRDAWKKYASTLGQEVLVKTEGKELQGVAEDVDERGALLLRLPDGKLERVLAGDVEQVRAKIQR